MPDDPRAQQFVEDVVSTVEGLYVAIASGAPPLEVVGHLALLVNTMIEHRDALTERPSDEPLRRAVQRLGAN